MTVWYFNVNLVPISIFFKFDDLVDLYVLGIKGKTASQAAVFCHYLDRYCRVPLMDDCMCSNYVLSKLSN